MANAPRDLRSSACSCPSGQALVAPLYPPTNLVLSLRCLCIRALMFASRMYA